MKWCERSKEVFSPMTANGTDSGQQQHKKQLFSIGTRCIIISLKDSAKDEKTLCSGQRDR
ncbi:hypothetical protein TYRP_006824 [Tyrophagus putrescentiae]|nr:hypothetical protein TYRP_006824 [Tyrophagus putrescentiae]